MRGNMDFWEIYNAYFSRIYAYVRCRCACAAETEDITSGVFHKALVKIAQFDPARGNLAQWLFGIARNEVNYQFRVKALRRFLPLDLFENSLASAVQAKGPGRQDHLTLPGWVLGTGISAAHTLYYKYRKSLSAKIGQGR